MTGERELAPEETHLRVEEPGHVATGEQPRRIVTGFPAVPPHDRVAGVAPEVDAHQLLERVVRPDTVEPLGDERGRNPIHRPGVEELRPAGLRIRRQGPDLSVRPHPTRTGPSGPYKFWASAASWKTTRSVVTP